jgi:hypothetical protein
VIDTSEWSQDEWDIIENCQDSERIAIAWQLANDPIQDNGQDMLPGIE